MESRNFKLSLMMVFCAFAVWLTVLWESDHLLIAIGSATLPFIIYLALSYFSSSSSIPIISAVTISLSASILVFYHNDPFVIVFILILQAILCLVTLFLIITLRKATN